MLTSSALTDPDVLLVGALAQHRRGPERGRPYLSVEVACPACRAPHCLPWPDTSRPDAVVQVELPCRDRGLYQGRRVFVGLDPSRARDNRRVADHHAGSLRRFLIERRMAHALADQRVLDRRYYRDFPDAAPLPPPGLYAPQP